MFSVTKSFTSALILTLAEEGLIDLSETVSRYLPALAETAYGDATVQHVMDMTNSIQYDETYDDPESDIGRYFAALAPGGRGLYHHLTTLDKQLSVMPMARRFSTSHQTLRCWVGLSEASRASLAENLESRIWKPMGAEHPAHYMLDPVGIELAGAGLSMSLRDAARFGQMILTMAVTTAGRFYPPVSRLVSESAEHRGLHAILRRPDHVSPRIITISGGVIVA